MTTADLVLSLLTGALVLATFIYAGFTYNMMRTASRAERDKRRPTLGLEVVSAEPVPLETLDEPGLMFFVRAINLGLVPLFKVAVEASVIVLGLEDKKMLYPPYIIPFLAPGESSHVTVSFIAPYETVYHVAHTVTQEFRITPVTPTCLA